MLFSIIILLPLAQLALAHPHLAPRRHHARAAAAAAAAEVTDRPLVERAGAAIGNDTRDEISAWRHSQEVVTASSSAVISSANGVQGVGTALTAVNSDSAIASPTSAVETSAQASLPVMHSLTSVKLTTMIGTGSQPVCCPRERSRDCHFRGSSAIFDRTCRSRVPIFFTRRRILCRGLQLVRALVPILRHSYHRRHCIQKLYRRTRNSLFFSLGICCCQQGRARDDCRTQQDYIHHHHRRRFGRSPPRSRMDRVPKMEAQAQSSIR